MPDGRRNWWDNASVLDPSQGIAGIPVRIISEPPGTWWNQPVFTLLVGLALGMFFEPAKEQLKEYLRRRRANSEIYNDLGQHWARFEKFSTSGIQAYSARIDSEKTCGRYRKPL
jgi:hypothetical protein